MDARNSCRVGEPRRRSRFSQASGRCRTVFKRYLISWKNQVVDRGQQDIRYSPQLKDTRGMTDLECAYADHTSCNVGADPRARRQGISPRKFKVSVPCDQTALTNSRYQGLAVRLCWCASNGGSVGRSRQERRAQRRRPENQSPKPGMGRMGS